MCQRGKHRLEHPANTPGLHPTQFTLYTSRGLKKRLCNFLDVFWTELTHRKPDIVLGQHEDGNPSALGQAGERQRAIGQTNPDLRHTSKHWKN